ncbi:cupin domain-containing protein [Moraxella sp. FZLJ2107]|uniref:cupin domain-containing protein n=1 Tax=unclassified Moraxella TaxID=2685852 RepID=UPI00209C3FF6|nr:MULTISPECIES: cupin domain-containing protein [unclassified Moraxella]USZ14369.1 cupin domain-containing protein [Moraxella sp. FZFQ2102]UTO05038.1 cupin domain-containing protein [Moraxella sp. FZLJ2107]UTO21773.1 cupin domain-containing protein [Moraxella sp. FZLJ2109]
MDLQLGRLEDLPQAYRDELEQNNLVPLWPSLRDVMPPITPRPKSVATVWPYQDIRPLLMQAGELTPIEKAERRVLVLSNPGLDITTMRASPVIYLGMQLILPGEIAPNHRHTPNAVRLIVEGQGGYTTVAGEKCPMEHGDLILTPSGMWHEHGHEGDEPVVWLDILDLPLVYYAEATYVEEGDDQVTRKVANEPVYQGGIVPVKHFERSQAAYPILRYRWEDAKRALENIAATEPDTDIVQVAYVNPETGEDCQKIIGYSAIMLRPHETVHLKLRSAAQVFHMIDGQVSLMVDDKAMSLTRSDTAVSPAFAHTSLTNLSDQPSFVFVADEAPFQKKLGLYSERDRADGK